MEVEVKIKATAAEMFDLLMNSAKHDIEQATGEEILLDDLVSGYTYEKKLVNKLGSEGNATGTLAKIEKPHIYEAEFSTIRGVNKLSYELKPLEDGYLNVIYKEHYEPISKNAELNFKFTNFFYKNSVKKRMVRMIYMMEAHIRNSNENNSA